MARPKGGRFFLEKKLRKAGLAVILAVAVSVVNILPAAAMAVGKPSLKKKKIEVTSQAEKEGYFEGEAGEQKSSAANARKATDSDARQKKGDVTFSDWEEDDGNGYTNLMLAAKATELSGKFGTNDNLTWELAEGVLTIGGSGEMPEWTFYNKSQPWYNRRDEIKEIIIEEGVANVGSFAFRFCDNLVSLVIPKTVKKIGEQAFRGCGNLKTIEFAGEMPDLAGDAFEDCKSIETSFPIAKGSCGENLTWELESLGKLVIRGTGAMTDWGGRGSAAPWNSNTQNIKSVTIENGVTSVGNYAFSACNNMVSAALPESLTSIGEHGFSGCTVLREIKIPKNVVSIGELAFYNCEELPAGMIIEKRTAGDSVHWEMCNDGTLTIGGSGDMPEWATVNDVPWENYFTKKPTIKKVVIQDGVTNIGKYAFSGCKDLTSIEIAETVTSIGERAFYFSSSLNTIKIPKNVTKIGSHAFSSCEKLANVELSESLKELGQDAFYNCTGLTSISIPGSMPHINSNIFRGCTNLAEVKLEEGIKCIYRHAFEGTAIKSVLIPESMNYLMQRAFPEETVITFAKKPGEGAALSSGNSRFVQTNNMNEQCIRSYWAKVVNSYLYEGENGKIYRVEYASDNVAIEQYSSDFRFEKSWKVAPELPIFGGFYAGEDAFYMVFGQKNSAEDDDVEVMRVVKYSKDMRRLDAVGVYEANTTIPFEAGSLRMDENDTYLYIRTCHEMYREYDGKRHQSNMTIAVHKEGMVLSHKNDSPSASNSTGYVGHSFNQFIRSDGEKVVALDLGDGTPRAVVMIVYPSADDMIEKAEAIELFKITGNWGENYTGVSVGGLEVSGSSYLAVFDSIDQDDFSDAVVRNVYLAAVNKDDLSKMKCIQVTDYSEGGTSTATTPHLVKVSENLFAVMWEEGSRDSSESKKWNMTGEVKVAYFDGNGNSVGSKKIDSFSGSLSDCKPVVINGKVTWYVTDGTSLSFYSYAAQPSSGIDVSKKTLKGTGSSGGSSGSGTGSSGGSSGGGGGGGGGRVSSSSSSGGSGSSARSGSTPVLTGTWLRDGIGWWLAKADGSYPKGQWASVNGATYYFNDAGYMAEGWLYWNGRWYYLLPGSGAMLTGWINVNGVWYYLNGDRSMATGWMNLGGIWYYLNIDGSMAVGWIQDQGKWYFLGFDGAMLADTITPDFYRVGADGAMIQ